MKVAFLDEIFKASSSILNALLTILNERKYHNGANVDKVPLQTLIAASNELPSEQEDMSALYDRFLARVFVDGVSPAGRAKLFAPVAASAPEPFSTTELKELDELAGQVILSQPIIDAVLRIWERHAQTFKDDPRERLSDRRLKKIIWLIQVSAASNGRGEADLSDLLTLKDFLWNHPDNIEKVRDLILTTLQECSRMVPTTPASNAASTSDDVTPLARADSRPERSSPSGASVAGLAGSGTAQDPLRVASVHDLMTLESVEVGQQGYHFLQTADIDCSAIKFWPEIHFKGYFDGGGHCIHHGARNDVAIPDYLATLASAIPNSPISSFASAIANSVASSPPLNVFASLAAEARVSAVRLQGFCLAAQANGGQVINCESDRHLISKNAADSTISNCTTALHLIAETATRCTITDSRSGYALIGGELKHSVVERCTARDILVFRNVVDSTISDCSAELRADRPITTERGGIAASLSTGSLMARCFVGGALHTRDSGTVYFSGLVNNCDSSTVQQCALGMLDTPSNVRLHRITQITDRATLKNNISLHSNAGASASDGPSGKTVDAGNFTQRYFEHQLKWDFDTTWEWDDAKSRPRLRPSRAGVSAAVGPGTVDLLASQVQNNIWL